METMYACEGGRERSWIGKLWYSISSGEIPSAEARASSASEAAAACGHVEEGGAVSDVVLLLVGGKVLLEGVGVPGRERAQYGASSPGSVRSIKVRTPAARRASSF
jgi:hypothetical protein